MHTSSLYFHPFPHSKHRDQPACHTLTTPSQPLPGLRAFNNQLRRVRVLLKELQKHHPNEPHFGWFPTRLFQWEFASNLLFFGLGKLKCIALFLKRCQ